MSTINLSNKDLFPLEILKVIFSYLDESTNISTYWVSKYFRSLSVIPKLTKKDIMTFPAKDNNPSLIVWLRTCGYRCNYLTSISAGENRSDNVIHLLSLNKNNIFTLFTKSCEAKNVKIARILYIRNKEVIKDHAFNYSVLSGDLDFVKEVFSEYTEDNFESYIFNAIMSGNIEVLNWLEEKNGSTFNLNNLNFLPAPTNEEILLWLYERTINRNKLIKNYIETTNNTLSENLIKVIDFPLGVRTIKKYIRNNLDRNDIFYSVMSLINILPNPTLSKGIICSAAKSKDELLVNEIFNRCYKKLEYLILHNNDKKILSYLSTVNTVNIKNLKLAIELLDYSMIRALLDKVNKKSKGKEKTEIINAVVSRNDYSIYNLFKEKGFIDTISVFGCYFNDVSNYEILKDICMNFVTFPIKDSIKNTIIKHNYMDLIKYLYKEVKYKAIQGDKQGIRKFLLNFISLSCSFKNKEVVEWTIMKKNKHSIKVTAEERAKIAKKYPDLFNLIKF